MLGIVTGIIIAAVAFVIYDRWVTRVPQIHVRMFSNYRSICGRECTIHRATRIAS